MRGDSYQLQGQQGGVVLDDGETVTGKFRSVLVLSVSDLYIDAPNIVDANGTAVSTSMGVLNAGTVLNGVFNTVYIQGVGAKAICYYGDAVPAPAVAPAYALGWQEPAVLLSSTNNSIVSIEGAFKEARRYGASAAPLVVGNVTFTHSNLGSPYQDNALFSSVGSSTQEMQSLVRNRSQDIGNGNNVPLTGFEVGKTYMLQWFFADERTTSNVQTRTQTITIGGYTKTFPAPLLGKTMKCYFIASEANLNLTVGAVGEQEAGVIMAFQIRQLD